MTFVSNYNNEEYLRETLLSGRSYSSFELIRASMMNVIIFSAFGLVAVGSALVFTFVRMLSIENAQRYARRFAQFPAPFISLPELAQISRANSPLGQSSGITPEWVYKKIVKSIKEGYLRGCSPEKQSWVQSPKTTPAATAEGSSQESSVKSNCSNVKTTLQIL